MPRRRNPIAETSYLRREFLRKVNETFGGDPRKGYMNAWFVSRFRASGADHQSEYSEVLFRRPRCPFMLSVKLTNEESGASRNPNGRDLAILSVQVDTQQPYAPQPESIRWLGSPLLRDVVDLDAMINDYERRTGAVADEDVVRNHLLSRLLLLAKTLQSFDDPYTPGCPPLDEVRITPPGFKPTPTWSMTEPEFDEDSRGRRMPNPRGNRPRRTKRAR
jgi:hypothetical protein